MKRSLFFLFVAVALPGALRGARAERWLKVTTPEFTVITSLPEAEAKAWSGEFAQYVAALRGMFHFDKKLAPLTIVLFARDRDFEAYRPLNPQGKPEEVDGFFYRHESWSVAGMAGAQQSEQVRRVIFHEGVHWFLSRMERPNPVWLEEGIAEVFSTFNVRKRDKDMEWGLPIENHVALLNRARPIPLAELLNTARADVFGDDTLRTGLVYAESWAFVHFLLFGQHKNMPREALPQFLAGMQGGATQDQAFRTAFGHTYREMDTELDDYMRGGRYYVRRVALVEVPPPAVEPAPEADVQNALARLAFAARRWEQAATHARATVAAAPDDPRGHEALGLILKQQDQAKASLDEFNLAIEKDTKDFMPFFEVAAALQNDAVGGPGGTGTLAPKEARRIANYYERAINLRPRFLPSYENLAGVIGVAEPWGKDDRDFFELGAQLFPDSAQIRLGLAILTHRSGDVAAARAQLAEILKDDELKNSTRSFARRLEDAWESHDVLTQVQKLTEEKKPAEALALVEQQLAGNIGTPLRLQLNALQRQLRTAVQTQALDEALRGQQWADARRIANEILDSNASPGLKAQVRRTLEQLDRRKLGLPKTPAPESETVRP